MSTIWLRDFKGGLDARRMPEALPGGFAIRAVDGHITRGGEFEQRAAFVPEYTLPAGQTVGLAVGRTGLHVFGHAAAPAMPKGVTYQRLQHPDGATALHRVMSADMFAGKLYVVAEYVDGSQYHFYDGARVTDWQDGRARASFTIVAGGIQAATPATGSFTVSGGTAGVSNRLSVAINGVALHVGSVQHTGANATTAAAIAAAINAAATNPDYTATSSGVTVLIASAAANTVANGLPITVTVSGDATVTGVGTMSGGQIALPSALVDLTVNGVSIIGDAVDWRGSNADTAQAIAEAVNNYSSTPDYTATAVGARVNVLAVAPGVGSNGYTVTPTLARGLVVSPSSGIVLANGLAPGAVFQSGTFAKTVGSKVYVTGGPSLFFSGVKVPTGFQTTNTGAGFIDMSTETSGAETLQALGKYLNFVVVFANRDILVWYVDPDPSNNKQAQTLNNMGTRFPRSVTQFGDNDLFFLDESGVRSLRSRDASNAASTSDIGIPVDPLVVAKLQSLSEKQRSEVIGLIEPSDGRFWLLFPDEIFVLSFFTGSKISAWSTYRPAGNGAPFKINDAQVLKRKVFIRSGDTIYSYGGLGAALVYDDTAPELQTPYLDADVPARTKDFTAIDVACVGDWRVEAGLDPTNLLASEKIATVSRTTYGVPTITYRAASTHISLRFVGAGPGYKKVAAAAIRFAIQGED
ncbi:hypothetical protein [Rhodopseudomonas pseudopalustris]|uniref:Uncharacterized protein n=1 Tax=Rhodopseudomonas pseudopalustris TaxID=1513892 RepID=A0A1H8WIY9_9BRAD|nr:hypothetical protein [Rhodopseudomonas pseudopalustris]SEP27483.1 hypothetical protein SAMN05444123_112128 [Rhodopseudomonas pseudopalustris]